MKTLYVLYVLLAICLFSQNQFATERQHQCPNSPQQLQTKQVLKAVSLLANPSQTQESSENVSIVTQVYQFLQTQERAALIPVLFAYIGLMTLFYMHVGVGPNSDYPETHYVTAN